MLSLGGRKGHELGLDPQLRLLVREGVAGLGEGEGRLPDGCCGSECGNNAVEKNAALLDVKKLVHKTEDQINVTGGGATDYGNVSYVCPGVMFYVEYGDNVVAHTPEYVALGKTEEAFNYLKNCAGIMAGVTYDFLTDEAFRNEVKAEYLRRLHEKGIDA